MASRKRTSLRQITLVRAISKFGWASRTEAARLVLHGRVRLDADVVRDPNLWVDPAGERISIDGRTLHRKKLSYMKMHKPAGVVTTRSDELGRRTVYDLLPKGSRWLFPIGRLDRETSGLLLFTNDTRFGQRVTDPLTKLPKTYSVVIDRKLEPEDRKRMEAPFYLDERTTLQATKVSVSARTPRQFEITIVEGKNRQIRKVCERLGYRILSLRRISIGDINLEGLKEGEVSHLTDKERNSVISFVEG